MENINLWSILVASIVAFVISAIWYSPILFGKEWMTLTGMSEDDIQTAKSNGVVKLYVFQFIFTVISFCVLGFAMSTIGTNTGSDGAFLGLLVWIGFILPIGASNIMWEKKPFKLVLINTIGTLLTLVVGGAIIGAW
jgi:hypothetical protein